MKVFFRYLKSGISPLKRDIVDKMDNYVLERGIRGRKAWVESWGEDFHMAQEKFNLLFEKLYPVFRKQNHTVSEYVKALYDFILCSEMWERMNQYADNFAEQEIFDKEEEYHKVYESVMKLLDQIVLLMGEEKITREEFKSVLESGFMEIKVGMIPQTIDTVVVGDTRRTRLKTLKCCL
jgi:ATP-dependent helicase/nuclease subunit B